MGSDVVAFTTKRTLGRDRQRLCRMLCIADDRLIIPHQTHTDRVLRIDNGFLQLPAIEKAERLEGIDAVFTDVRGICIGVSTADCIPVLLYDAERKAVASIHAGWRGTVKGIVGKTVKSMTEALGTNPRNLKAVIGPGISCERFEVGDEVYEEFRSAGFDMSGVAVKYDKWHLDLRGCNRMQLLDYGLGAENIHVERICTFDNTGILFSARVEQKGAEKCGRNFNAIMLKL